MNNQTIIEQIHNRSIPLHSTADLQKLVDAIGDAKFVLIGEASHGTSEFYTWRAELSKLLIEQKNFNFVAVEGDYCADEVVQLLKNLQQKHQVYNDDNESDFSSELNALVAVNAEKYYRSMIRGGPDSWNIRDRHMTEALQKITDFHGEGAKAIVWEHNTHIGDARATDMKEDGMINVGQLVREQYSDDEVFAVGFSSYEGTVIAANAWAAPAEIMEVPKAIRHSWEFLFHEAQASDQLIIFDNQPSVFEERRGHRAIGVVYHPQYEQGNYVPTVLSARYNALIYLDQTRALEPLESLKKVPAAFALDSYGTFLFKMY
jgi:erythromycin esterase-like protein